MGAALPFIMAASAGVSAVGAIEQGQAQSQAASYQAEVSSMNAKIAKENATYEQASGEQQMYNQQQKARATVGAIVAAQGANNLDVNSGSNLSVRTGTEEMARLDALTIKNEAARKAWGYEAAAAGDTAQAGLYRSEASSSALAGYINAGSSILGGASSIGKLYWPSAATP
jgi:hypothetical protein